MRYSYLTLLFAALVGAITAESGEKGCVYTDYRLPQRIKPEHYNLRLDVDTDEFKYQGEVRIILTANDDQSAGKKLADNVIVLHANASISIDDVQFNRLDSESQGGLTNKIGDEIENICHHKENELLVITLKQQLSNNSRGELVISFHANINDDPNYRAGFHKNAPDSGQEAIVSTQFEAVAARQAFPCFDEPNFKATFDVTLVHDPKLVALSNGAIKSEHSEPETGRRVTRYQRTPRMSTYLVAFAIGDFEHIEQVVSDGRLTIRVFAQPGRVEEGRFALETAVRAINLMEEYFDIPFVMDKIDMVALPIFDRVAMENWGLILCQHDVLLYDQKNVDSKWKGHVVSTVVHELAHQWFGNLVTMNWWNDLWLNEGFAAWMQDRITHQLYPEFEWDYIFLRYGQIGTLNRDAKLNTHSCQVEDVGRDPDAFFDSLVYRKAESILRLVHDVYLGPERFREGIRKYIKDNVYGNTEASDLWNALKEVSGLPVDELMKSWITQPGHPEVQVELVKDNDKKSLHLKQKRRFSSEPTEEQKQVAAEQKWIIPINLIVADDKGNTNTMKLVMDTTETQFELPDWFDAENKDHWIKLNAGFMGFYRVRYSRDLLMRLEKPCRSKTLETIDRLNLIHDIFFDNDLLSNEELYKIMDWFSGDYEGVIMLLKDDTIFHLFRTRSDDTIKKMRNLVGESFVEIHKRHGFKIDSSESSLTDAQAISTALLRLVQKGYEPVVQDALKEFDENVNNGSADLRMALYWAVASSGSDEQIDKLYELRKETKHPSELKRIDDFLRMFESNKSKIRGILRAPKKMFAATKNMASDWLDSFY